MEKYSIGVIGAGARGEMFARQLYAGTPDAELFGICDIDEDRLKKFCDYCELEDIPRFADPDRFLQESGLDAVIVTVPEFAHKEVTLAALAAGKHVYVEKPLAHTLEDSRAIARAGRDAEAVAFVGFNVRAYPSSRKLKEIINSGVLGQILHISGLSQLSREHGAAFMRRFHRNTALSGGMLNHKCSHDLDLMLWLIGHEHRVARVASLGGTDVFTPDKQPAERCSECPPKIREECPYEFEPGYIFPVRSDTPLYHRREKIYGGDLCVYSPDKDIVDNQALIMEFDNNIRGDFRLQMFQAEARRRLVIWGEEGVVELDSMRDPQLRLITSEGNSTLFRFAQSEDTHVAADRYMIGQFVAAMERGDGGESGLSAGLAAALLAFKGERSRREKQMVEVAPEEYI